MMMMMIDDDNEAGTIHSDTRGLSHFNTKPPTLVLHDFTSSDLSQPTRGLHDLPSVGMVSDLVLFWSRILPVSSPNLQQTKMLPQTEVSTSERLADVNTSSQIPTETKKHCDNRNGKEHSFRNHGKKTKNGKKQIPFLTCKHQKTNQNSLIHYQNWWKIKGQIPPKVPFGPGCPFKLWRY